MKRVSLADVAQAAGLGRATVSRALSGHEEVGAATRARVLDIAADMGYRPHEAARALRTGRTRVVGVAVPGGAPASGADDDVAHQLLALSRSAAAAGYRLLVDVVDLDAADPFGHLDGLAVDGLLLLVPGGHPAPDRRLPTVVVDGADVDDAARALVVLLQQLTAPQG